MMKTFRKCDNKIQGLGSSECKKNILVRFDLSDKYMDVTFR